MSLFSFLLIPLGRQAFVLPRVSRGGSRVQAKVNHKQQRKEGIYTNDKRLEAESEEESQAGREKQTTASTSKKERARQAHLKFSSGNNPHDPCPNL